MKHSEEEKHILVGPRDFIRPPSVECPKCKAAAFGIVTVASHQYSRRCRLCLYPTYPEHHPATPLPPLDKKVIYLDQFCVSRMMFAINKQSKRHGKDAHKDFFLDLFYRLDLLGKKQLIVCPASEFHEDESSVSDSFAAFRRMYELLSYSVRFEPANRIRGALVRKAFAGWKNNLPVRLAYQKKDFVHGDLTGWTDRFSLGAISCRYVSAGSVPQRTRGY